jgi:putative transposase
MDIFIDDDDRERYLHFISKYGTKFGLELSAYCLMSNHIHLVAIPEESDSLARFMGLAHMCYTQHFNRKYSLSGHLWQGRFYSCVLDERHAIAAARYVERNPVRAGLVGHAWNYKWSSARAHIGEAHDPILTKKWPSEDLLGQWQQLLIDPEDDEGIAQLRHSTRHGYPLGSRSFILKLEHAFDRSLRRRPVGRPGKRRNSKVISEEKKEK